MFLQTNESIHAAQILAGDFKFWAGVIGVGGILYKGYQWVKEIRTKDVPDIKAEVSKLSLHLGELGLKLDNQTSQVVSELKEMRSDFRTFYCAPQSNPAFPNQMYGMPMMQPVHAKPLLPTRKAAAKPRKKREPKPETTPESE